MEKNRITSYMKIYDELFSSIKDNKLSLLEVVKDNGNDIEMWKKYFKNGEIYVINKDDAYNEEIILKRFNNKKFNIIIENGSYDIYTLIKFIKIYTELLTNNGILIIENLQSLKYVYILRNATPLIYHNYLQAFDLREINENYDDVLFVINKTNFIEEIKNDIFDNDELNKELLNNSELSDEFLNYVNNELLIKEKEKEIKIKNENPFNDIYNILFRKRKNDNLILLDIGLNEKNMKYLIDYFSNSLLFGIGIKKDIDVEIKKNNRIKLYLETSPYNINLESSNIKFDIIFSTNESNINNLIFLINTYIKILNENGILIIEDVNDNDIEKIKEMIDPEIKDITENYKKDNKNILIINK